jgi:FkbM family methyltransferase
MFSLLPRYVKNIGLVMGPIVFFKVEILNLERFWMRGYPAAFHLRRQTTDRKVFREIFLFRMYKLHLPDAPAIIVDAGANIGLSSIFFAKEYPSAQVYAVEPEESNFACLLKNVKNYPNIIPIRAAVWPREKKLKIKNKDEHHWAFNVVEARDSEETFPGITIQALMDKFKINKIDLVKFDIEGSEREIFSENYQSWLSQTRYIIIELHDWLNPGSSSAFFRAIANFRIHTKVHEGMLLVEIKN